MAVENAPASGRQDQPKIKILPYSRMVGQEQIKLALEIAFIAPQDWVVCSLVINVVRVSLQRSGLFLRWFTINCQ
jgi:hypothetical protein